MLMRFNGILGSFLGIGLIMDLYHTDGIMLQNKPGRVEIVFGTMPRPLCDDLCLQIFGETILRLRLHRQSNSDIWPITGHLNNQIRS